MKCISCEVEINPQWQHAIDMNVCPFCGKHIMEEHLKKLFTSLRETMDALQTYPDQLNDWMMSNHNYIKTDSPEIGKFMPKDMIKELKKLENDEDFQRRKNGQKFTVKVQTEDGEQEVQSEKIQSEERTQEFFQRAGVVKNTSSNPNGAQAPNNYQTATEKTQYLKKVAQQIKRAGSPVESGGVMISTDMLANADPEAVAEFQSMISGGEVVSSLDSGGDDDDIPPAVLAMAARSSGGGNSKNAADLLKLQQMQDRMKRSREAFESGENRGGKGGGFSRA